MPVVVAAKPLSLLRGILTKDNVVVGEQGGCLKTSISSSNHIQSFEYKPSLVSSSATSDVSSTAGPTGCISMHDSLDDDQSEFADMSDQDLLLCMEEAARDDKLLLLSRYLGEMERRNLKLQDGKRHDTLMEQVRMIEEVILEHTTTPEAGGWKKNCEMHGKLGDTIIYQKLNEKQEIDLRFEMAMDESLLVPFISVLNETGLYTTWLPSYQRPIKFGVRKSDMFQQTGRALQIARVRLDTPWPMKNREIVAFNIAADAVDEVGAIVVKVKSLDGGEHSGIIIPPCPSGWDRIAMEWGFTSQQCPKDHPALAKRRATTSHQEPILMTLTVSISPSHNIVLRTLASPLWAVLLHVAQGVRDGKRPLHKKAIEEKPELYGWIAECVDRMKATSSEEMIRS